MTHRIVFDTTVFFHIASCIILTEYSTIPSSMVVGGQVSSLNFDVRSFRHHQRISLFENEDYIMLKNLKYFRYNK